MNANEIHTLATELDQATQEAREIDRLTLRLPELTVDDAYRVQEEGLRLRLARGEKIIGYKMGLTSRAKMKQMNVEAPIYGVLTQSMRLENGAQLSFKGRIHPKGEPEIGFIVAREIAGAMSAREALDHCSGVFVGIEVIDSRYRNFQFQLPDVIADNCSASAFVMSEKNVPPAELGWESLGNLGMLLEIDGVGVGFGSSSAILGHPAESLAMLSRMLHERSQKIPAGSIVLAGSSTEAILLSQGTRIQASAQALGSCRIKL